MSAHAPPHVIEAKHRPYQLKCEAAVFSSTVALSACGCSASIAEEARPLMQMPTLPSDTLPCKVAYIRNGRKICAK